MRDIPIQILVKTTKMLPLTSLCFGSDLKSAVFLCTVKKQAQDKALCSSIYSACIMTAWEKTPSYSSSDEKVENKHLTRAPKQKEMWD